MVWLLFLLLLIVFLSLSLFSQRQNKYNTNCKFEVNLLHSRQTSRCEISNFYWTFYSTTDDLYNTLSDFLYSIQALVSLLMLLLFFLFSTEPTEFNCIYSYIRLADKKSMFVCVCVCGLMRFLMLKKLLIHIKYVASLMSVCMYILF